MAVDLAILVMTPSLRRGHLIDLMRGYESSGFYDHDKPDLRARQDALVQEARRAFTDMEVFSEGPLAGRRMIDMSVRMQTLGLAPRHMAFDREAQLTLEDAAPEVLDLHGTAFVVTTDIIDLFVEAFRALDRDPSAITAFLEGHIGLIAAFVGE